MLLTPIIYPNPNFRFNIITRFFPRLTIGINVRFFDKNDSESDFEKRFSFYYDYPGNSQLIGSQKETAVDEIFERITQDIFNEALAKW